MILAGDLVPVLRIQLNRNFSGTDQVAEQNRQMPPFAFGGETIGLRASGATIP